MRNSFIIYRSFYEAIKDLDATEQGKVWTAICEFSLNKKEIKLTGLSSTVFKLIKPQLEANMKKFDNGVKFGKLGAEHGKKGGRPKTPKKPSENPQETLKEPSNDNDNLNPNPNDNPNPNPNPNPNDDDNPKEKFKALDYFTMDELNDKDYNELLYLSKYYILPLGLLTNKHKEYVKQRAIKAGIR